MTTQTTEINELLEAVEGRVAKATSGPFMISHGNTYFNKLGKTFTADLIYERDYGGRWIAAVFQDEFDVDEQEANGDMLAHARTDLPALCAALRDQDTAIRELTADRDSLRAALERLTGEIKQPTCNDCGVALGDNWCADCAAKAICEQLRAQLAAANDRGECEWTWNSRKEFYASACGDALDADINHFTACPFCGKKIKVAG